MHQDSIKNAINDIRISSREFTDPDTKKIIPYRRVTLVYIVKGVQTEMDLKATPEQISLLEMLSSVSDTNEQGSFLTN